MFPRWLTAVAFEPKGLIMKHAMDVAIMIDTLAYDPRLDLKYMIPVSTTTTTAYVSHLTLFLLEWE